MKVGQIIS
jgi:hypothetical protein